MLLLYVTRLTNKFNSLLIRGLQRETLDILDYFIFFWPVLYIRQPQLDIKNAGRRS